MEELSGPVVGIALVLSAVFVPTAFIPGITGRLYQQFAVTIAISVLFSAFNALTLSPALAALLLRPREESHGLLRRFFDWFNRVFERANEGYVRWSGVLVQKTLVVAVLLVALRRGCRILRPVACRRAFFPMKTRAMPMSPFNSPTGLRWNARQRSWTDVEKIIMNTPGVQILDLLRRLQSVELCSYQL